MPNYSGLFRALNQFQKHAICRRRVHESDQAALCSDTGFFVDEPHPPLFKTGERRFNVLNLDCYMMNSTAAAFFEKFAYWRIIRNWFQKLDPAFTERQHRNSNLLVFNDFRMNVFEAEGIFPELQGFFYSTCCNS